MDKDRVERRDDCRLPMAPALLLPHKPPMLFVDRLVERYGDRATAEATVPDSGICVSGGELFVEYFIELVAQTVAMANGFDLLQAGSALTEGMLVGIDRFTIRAIPAPGELLTINTEKSFEFGPVKVISGKVWCSRELVAEGEIKVWEKVEEDSAE